jgi:hypothetical protein
VEFVRIKEDILRLDMITRIRESRHEETFYGRSVRKGSEGWIDVYFIGGEVVKLEGESAEAFRRFLEHSCAVRDLCAPAVENPAPPPKPAAPQAAATPHGHAPHGHAMHRGRGPHA